MEKSKIITNKVDELVVEKNALCSTKENDYSVLYRNGNHLYEIFRFCNKHFALEFAEMISVKYDIPIKIK